MAEETMGQRIQRLRTEAGLSQQVLADRAGIPVATLRNWEYGRRVPLLDAAARLADALGCTLDVLAGRGEASAPPDAPGPAPEATKRPRGRPPKKPPSGQPSPAPDAPEAGQEEKAEERPSGQKKGRRKK